VTSPFEDEGQADPDPMELEQVLTGQGEGTIEPPHDTAMAVDDFGTTPAEMHDGESLDGRLVRELPEVSIDAYPDESVPAGRLVAPDEGARTDTEKDLVGSDLGSDFGGLTAEEQAMRIEPESP
jgi:hypothetical protein